MKKILDIIQMFIMDTNNSWLVPKRDTMSKLEDLQYTFTEKQSEQEETIIRILLDSEENNLLITGKAGVGKTFLIKCVSAIVRCFDCNVVVVSSSGVASQNAEGQTINSVFNLGIGRMLPSIIPHDPATDGRQIPSLGSVDRQMKIRESLGFQPSLLVIVDEVFSCSSEQLHLIVSAIRTVYKGKAKIIMLGDNGQLGPVETNDEKNEGFSSYPSKPARFYSCGEVHTFPSILESCELFDNVKYNAPYSNSWIIKKIHLVENQRQKEDRDFADALNWLRAGNGISGPAIILRDCFTDKKGMPSDIYKSLHLFGTKKDAQIFNNKGLEKSISNNVKHKTYEALIKKTEQTPYERASSHVRGLNNDDAEKKLSKICDSIPLIQTLAIGLPFMVRQNDAKKGVYNGTIGIIEQLNTHSIVIDVKGMKVEISMEVIKSVNTDKYNNPVVHELKALPGQLALGMTGHKAQGLSIDYPCVVHIVGRVNWIKYVPGWFYVVCSRVTKRDYLFIEGNVDTANNINTARPEVKEENLKLEYPFITSIEGFDINFRVYFSSLIYDFSYNTETLLYTDSDGSYTCQDFGFDAECKELIKLRYGK